MNLAWLQDVLILLEEGNLSRAAERRAVTQPAFSRRIRSFEEWIGTEILERGKNHVALKENLRGNEAAMRGLVSQIEELRGRIRGGEARSERIVLAAQHALALSVFSDIFALTGTRVTFRLRTTNRDESISIFLRGEAEALLVYEAESDPRLPFDESVARFVWARDRLVPVVGGKLVYTLDDEGRLPIGSPMVRYPESSYLAQVLDRHLPQWPIDRQLYATICESAFSVAAKEMVLNGVGMAWVPLSLVRDDLKAGKAVSLASRHGSLNLQACLYVRRNATFANYVTELVP